MGSALVLAALAAGCRSSHGKLRIQPLTHVAVGQSAPLAAYEEIKPAGIFGGAKEGPITRSPVTAKWTVSDPAVATVDDTGKLTALKAGKVTVKAAWEGTEANADVQVVTRLAAKYVPQISAKGSATVPTELALAFGKDRSLKLQAHFDNAADDFTLDAKAPDQKLPWSFPYPKGTVEIKAAAGKQVTGTVKASDGGAIDFTVWSNDEGYYPISLQGKTFVIIGDSMAEGLAWFMREKIEKAGGKFFSDPYYSSTTVKWADEHRMTQMIQKYHPDIVWITLGSNEVIVPNVEGRASAVKQITEEIGDRPAYWIGPPSWKPDRGIVHVIEANFRPGYFYNSNDLKVPRNRDGAHPTRDGFHTWTELLWAWYAEVG
jgi:hypothetical protein